MNNETDISLKFTNKINSEAKLERYERRLQSIKNILETFPKDVNLSAIEPKAKDYSKTLEQIYKQLTNSIKVTDSFKKKTISSLSSIKDVANATRNAGNEAKETGNLFDKAFSIGRFSTYLYGLKKVTSTFTNLIDKSSDYLENINLYQVAFNGAYQEADKFVNTITEMYGLDESWATKTVGIFRQLANAMGLATDTGETLSKLMTQMSIDVSSLYNVDIGRASTVLQSALAGQTRPIRSVAGADITMNTLQGTLNELGIDRAISDLSFAEKRLIIVVSLVKQLNQSIGDFGRTIESPANQLRVMNEQWERLSRAVGNVFLPIVSKVLPYLNAILMVLTEIISSIATLLGFKLDDYDYFGGIDDSVIDLEEGLNGANESAKKLKQSLRGFDKLNNITTPSATSTSVGAGGISGDILGAFDDAYAEYMSKLDKIQMKATKIRDKIMEWLGFTKEIDSKTGDVSFKFDHITTGTLIGGLIVGGVLFTALTKIFSIIGGINKLLGGTGLFKSLTSLIEPIKVLGGKDGLHYIFLEATASLKKFLPILTKVVKVLAGAVLVFKGSNGITNSFKEMRKQLNYTGEEANKYRLGVLETVGGGALIGSMFGPLGTAIGALTGVVIAGVSAWNGYQKAIEEIAKSELFGNLSISAEQWTEILSNSTTAIEDWGEKWQGLNLESLYTDFIKSADALDYYGYKFGLLKTKITEEDAVGIKNAVKDMAENSSQIIQETTDYDFELWSTTFKNMGTVTEEEEKNILQNILNYGNDQQKELKTAQDNITKTYDNAIKTRGYLTDEEYNYIQTQLDKIRKLTENEMTKNQSNIEYYKTLFKDRNVKLDEESYEEFQKALSGFEKERLATIETNYNEMLKSAERYHKEHVDDEEGYQKLLKTAYETRNQEISTLNDELTTIQGTVYEDLGNRYEELTGKVDEESKKQKQLIENIFKNVNLDDSELRRKFKQAGVIAGQSFGDGFGGKFSMNGNITIGGGGGRALADGGMPPVGQLFVANERGPELVGEIGGQTFVANQHQMLDIIKGELATAKGSTTNATFIVQVGDEQLGTYVIKDLEGKAKANGKPFTIGG